MQDIKKMLNVIYNFISLLYREVIKWSEGILSEKKDEKFNSKTGKEATQKRQNVYQCLLNMKRYLSSLKNTN